MQLIILKGLHRGFPPNHELFCDVKMKNGDVGFFKLRNWKGQDFYSRNINNK